MTTLNIIWFRLIQFNCIVSIFIIPSGRLISFHVILWYHLSTHMVFLSYSFSIYLFSYIMRRSLLGIPDICIRPSPIEPVVPILSWVISYLHFSCKSITVCVINIAYMRLISTSINYIFSRSMSYPILSVPRQISNIVKLSRNATFLISKSFPSIITPCFIVALSCNQSYLIPFVIL